MALLVTGFGTETRFIDTLIAEYNPRIEDAATFALRNRVLLLKTADGVGMDVSLGLPVEECVVCRATLFSFGPGLGVRTCSAEDLELHRG